MRLSDLCLQSNQMAFVAGGTLTAPSFTEEPPANTLVGYGRLLTLTTLVSGSLPIAYQWQQNSSGGYANLPDQTNNLLEIANTFAITNGFVAGLNTLDFVVANATGDFTGLRAQSSGVGQALSPGPPVLTNQPEDQTVRDANYGGGGSAFFAVVALGRPPLSYQWWSDGAPLADVTSRTLTFNSPYAGGQGTNFFVIVSNDSGSVTSRVATLTLLPTNRPPAVSNFTYSVYLRTMRRCAPSNVDLDSGLALIPGLSEPAGPAFL